jgi:hypothetical protein
MFGCAAFPRRDISGPLDTSANFSSKDATGWGAVRYDHHTLQSVGVQRRDEVADSCLVARDTTEQAWPGFVHQLIGDLSVSDDFRSRLRDSGSQATKKRFAGRTVQIGVLSLVAPRDTFNGVGVGRKAGSEVGEAVRRGHLFSDRTTSQANPETGFEAGR